MIKKIHILTIIMIIFVILGLFFFSTRQSQISQPGQSLTTPHVSFTTKYGVISVPVKLPETPDNVTLYTVVEQPNDTVFFSVINIEQTRSNVTPESEAPSVVKKILDQYGGLPVDSQISMDETQYLEEYSGTDQLIAKIPVSTSVQYVRMINGHQVAGNGGYIRIELGTNGELLYLDKVWRTVIPNGTVHVISAKEAVEKMQRGEILGMAPKCGCELNVNKIILTYREDGRNVSQESLDPVWVFSGTLSDGNPWNYQVYAWNSSEGYQK